MRAKRHKGRLRATQRSQLKRLQRRHCVYKTKLADERKAGMQKIFCYARGPRPVAADTRSCSLPSALNSRVLLGSVHGRGNALCSAPVPGGKDFCRHECMLRMRARLLAEVAAVSESRAIDELRANYGRIKGSMSFTARANAPRLASTIASAARPISVRRSGCERSSSRAAANSSFDCTSSAA